jgi:hypothetical protein
MSRKRAGQSRSRADAANEIRRGSQKQIKQGFRTGKTITRNAGS